MGNRQTKADGKKNFDFTASGLKSECGRVKRKRKNNDEVIMGSRQTEADGKKNIVDFAASGLKSVCGRVEWKKENNSEVIMGNRQTKADGKKKIDFTSSGLKIIKGSPPNEVLEVLAHRISPDCWKPLGRRLRSTTDCV